MNKRVTGAAIIALMLLAGLVVCGVVGGLAALLIWLW